MEEQTNEAPAKILVTGEQFDRLAAVIKAHEDLHEEATKDLISRQKEWDAKLTETLEGLNKAVEAETGATTGKDGGYILDARHSDAGVIVLIKKTPAGMLAALHEGATVEAA